MNKEKLKTIESITKEIHDLYDKRESIGNELKPVKLEDWLEIAKISMPFAVGMYCRQHKTSILATRKAFEKHLKNG